MRLVNITGIIDNDRVEMKQSALIAARHRNSQPRPFSFGSTAGKTGNKNKFRNEVAGNVKVHQFMISGEISLIEFPLC